MSPEEERRFVTREIRVVIAFVVIILVIWAFVPTCRADSTVTNQQIADSLPKLREKWIATLEDSIRARDRRTAQIDSILSHMRFDSGRIIFTCPVEIRFDSFPPNFSYGLSINIKELQVGNVVVGSSAIPTVRARGLDSTSAPGLVIHKKSGNSPALYWGNWGLDSVYVLPHDSLVNCRQVPIDCPDHVQGCLVYHFKNVCDTIRVEPHWIYFLWRNGKRTDIREKP